MGRDSAHSTAPRWRRYLPSRPAPWRLVAAVAVTLAAAAIVGYSVYPRQEVANRAHRRAAPVARPSEPPVARRASGPKPVPSKVAKRLHGAVSDRDLGRLHAAVLDARTGTTLYARQARTPSLPASVTKLITASAILHARGPAYRFTTKVMAGRHRGEVVLVGGGDPTLQSDNTDMYPQAARLDRLAAAAKRALHGRKPSRILVDSSLFGGRRTGPYWDDDIVPTGNAGPVTALMVDTGFIDPETTVARYEHPDLAAGRRFARMLGVPHAKVVRGSAGDHARRIASVSSPPLVHIVELMLQRSDNMIAETLAHDVAVAAGHRGSFAAGVAASIAQLHKLGVRTTGLQLYDGSGLSRGNRIPPRLLASLLAVATRTPSLWPVYTGIPVSGYSGTLIHAFTDPPDSRYAGQVRAKTGSLSGVSTLAGLVVDRDGRLLSYALMAERISSNYLADRALDHIAARLAGCGC